MTTPASTFHSIDEWKTALMTLPDQNFFDLMRSVMSGIKTPFNKQRLMDDLVAFLTRDEILRVVAAYIDAQDRRIIAAVDLLREPPFAELEAFFAGDLSYETLHAAALNLEERLILYRFLDPGEPGRPAVQRVALNPVFESVLAPIAADRTTLFPSHPTAGSGGGPVPFIDSPRTVAAFFSHLASSVEAFGPGGALKKKTAEDLSKKFPGVDLPLTLGALLQLELFREEGGRFTPNDRRIQEFGELSAGDRREYWAAGVYLRITAPAAAPFTGPGSGLPSAGVSDPGRSPRIVASQIHRLAAFMDPGRQYPKSTIRRFVELLHRDAGDEDASRSWGWRMLETPPRLPFEPLMTALTLAGLLEDSGGFWRLAPPAPGGDAAAGPFIAMDSAFTFVVYPEIVFSDAVALSAFCAPVFPAAGDVTAAGDRAGERACERFEISRGSVVAGFDRGMSAGAMLDLLGRLSGNRIDENLDWTIRDWEARYTAVSLDQGLVLSLAEDRRYLAEARPLSGLIRRVLAPGVYLLRAGDRGDALDALRRAGVDIVAQPDPAAPAVGYGAVGTARLLRPALAFPPLGRGVPLPGEEAAPAEVDAAPAAADTAAGAGADVDVIKARFRERLAKMRVTAAEADELASRIERRLVLTESQLEAPSIRYEKLEARGIDYTGKTTLAKQALATGCLLEAAWPAPGGGVQRVTGALKAMEKKDKKSGECFLVIKPRSPVAGGESGDAGEKTAAAGDHGSAGAGEAEAGDTVRVPLGKISSLRLLKQSIFGE